MANTIIIILILIIFKNKLSGYEYMERQLPFFKLYSSSEPAEKTELKVFATLSLWTTSRRVTNE